MVIIIDDESNSLPTVLLQEAIEKLGQNTEWYTDVTKAVEFVRTADCSEMAFVLDIMMPHSLVFPKSVTGDGRLTGLSIYSQIRERFPANPVFLFTNLTDGIIQSTIARDSNAYNYVKTNVYYDELAQTIVDEYSRFLRRKQK